LGILKSLQEYVAQDASCLFATYTIGQNNVYSTRLWHELRGSFHDFRKPFTFDAMEKVVEYLEPAWGYKRGNKSIAHTNPALLRDFALRFEHTSIRKLVEEGEEHEPSELWLTHVEPWLLYMEQGFGNPMIHYVIVDMEHSAEQVPRPVVIPYSPPEE